MSLDDRTAAVYSALDSVTLLALLPALRHEAERAKEETDTFERVRQVIPDQRAGLTDPVSEMTIIRDRRSGESRDRPGADGELGKVLDRLGRYQAELLERERWIRSDLVRRGLLPEYPFWGER